MFDSTAVFLYRVGRCEPLVINQTRSTES